VRLQVSILKLLTELSDTFTKPSLAPVMRQDDLWSREYDIIEESTIPS
jgi:hypothetical protein